MASTDPRLAEATWAERERLASVFDTLDSAQWASDSLCEGWRAREVLAHITMPFRLSGPAFLGGMLRARFRFDRFADRDARAAAKAMSDQELIDLYRANIRHPWRPPGGGQAGALSHDLIHGLDITEPAGLPGPPADRIALVIGSGRSRNFDYFGVDLGGRSLVATDADCEFGEGEPHRLPAKDLLLVVTGRRALDETA
ncbi:maleylpyruvate isomerase family mycothiol-dependent enzyme [Glycomyces salinus]|uniref:maleylpyruvate isomerase family mycothiol-dependent enzyme n=1 Tax=Glycomyces salinus TaxID=980294 RepID=UPI0018EB90FB|nr:maleylpyruvate isomerase family mycothiol-dependent enzyme [Glycomyces salinus]